MKLKGLKNLQPILLQAGGAVAGNFLTKLVPIGNDRVKQAIVAAVGIVLSGSKGAIGNIGSGLAVGSIANLAKGFGIGGDGFIMGTDGFIGEAGDESINGSMETAAGFSDGNY